MATPEFHLSARKPLLPKNTAATNVNFVVMVKEGTKTTQVNSKPKQEYCLDDASNKENLNHRHPITMYATPTKKKKKMEEAALDLDSSLAEELSAMRKRLERLRLDKEKTEKMLKEREAILDSQGDGRQRSSPIKSLREKQQGGRKINEVQSLDIKAADWKEESMDENTLQSPTPSDASEFVGENNND